MKKMMMALALVCSTQIFSCPDCGGECEESSKIPKIEEKGGYLMYTDICKDLYEDKDGFLESLMNYNVIESKEDVIVWDKDLIILNPKKKEPPKSVPNLDVQTSTKSPNVVITVTISSEQ